VSISTHVRNLIAPLAVLVGLLAATPAYAAFPGANGRIAYSHCDTNACNDSDIFTIDQGGGGATPVVLGADYTDDPAYSADGRRIAFESCPPSASGCGIDVVNADGSGRIPLTPIGGDRDDYPSFSPDGGRVVFKRQEASSISDAHIYIVNSDGSGGVTPLTSGSFFDTRPVFSPDGSKILFQRFAATDLRIYVMNPDGSGQTPLTSSSDTAGSAQWSPDGTKIVFTRTSVGPTEAVWVMDPDGSNQHQLTDPGANILDREPSFSSDGTRIVFERFDSVTDSEPLMVMNADGSGATPIPNTDYSYHPTWQPTAPPAGTPTISGTAVNGQTLTAQAAPEPPFTTVTLAFARCNASGESCAGIATGASYKLTSADIGHAIRVVQASSNGLGTNSAASTPTKAVAPNPAACSNVFTGTSKRDVFRGTRGGDRFAGLRGNDILSGGPRADCLSGGKGKDRISGGTGRDRLSGGPGKDKIRGGKGRDRVSGGGRNDTINVVDGKRDRVNCGKGHDTVRADKKDRLRGCEQVIRTG
jgi:Tol biopolymer transport system component